MKLTSSPLNTDTLQNKVVSPDIPISNKLRRSQAVRERTLEKGEIVPNQCPPTPTSSSVEVEEDVYSLSDAHPSALNSILVQQFQGGFESKTNIKNRTSEDRLNIYKQEAIQKILSVNLQPSRVIQEFQKIFADFLEKIASDLVVGTQDSDMPLNLNNQEVKSVNIQRDVKHTPVEINEKENFNLIIDGEVSMASDLFRGCKSSLHESKQNNQFNSIVMETPEKLLERDAKSPNIGIIPETPVPNFSTSTPKKQIQKSSREKLLTNLEKKPSPSVTKSSVPTITAGTISISNLDLKGTDISQQKSPSKSIRNEVREHLDGRYQPVSDGIVGILDEHKKLIFDLPSIFWPILPMGYKWFQASKKTLPIVKKHLENKERELKIYAFGPNKKKDAQINYVTWFDQFNVQAYANARPKGKTHQGTRKYPIDEYGTINRIEYDRGHCIDHADTITDNKKNLSSSHPKNFIPEPRLYNRNIRKTWVGKTRTNSRKDGLNNMQSHGAYMQRIYYHPISLYDMSMPLLTTKNKTPIPTGGYFSEIDWQRKAIVRAADFSWSYDFSKLQQKPTYLDDALPIFSINSHLVPTALVHQSFLPNAGLDEIMHQYQQRLDSIPEQNENLSDLQNSRYSRQTFEQIYQAAETEYLTITYKFEFALWCASHNLDVPAKIYLKRAEEHARFLTKTNLPCRISKSQFTLFEINSHNESKIFNDEKLDFWKKLSQK